MYAVSILILELEIVTGRRIFVLTHTDDFAFVDKRRQRKIFRRTGKDFIRATLIQAHHRDPFFVIVLETDHIGLQYIGTGRCLAGFHRFLFLLVGHQNPRA